jgi:decaprenyl-phosphate phosphoribosyltransferase
MSGPRRPEILDYVRLARPTQWAKGVFVLVGPVYAFGEGKPVQWAGVLAALLVFGLASSGGYVVNDIRDREADRAHPRKRRRPIASGVISIPAARVFGAGLFVAAAASLAIVPLAGGRLADMGWLAAIAGLYMVNTTAYSMGLKQVAVVDVMSLSFGFVLRVVAGCVAAGPGVDPSTWLLNCAFFLSMFLSFGKRLGERRTMGDAAAAARGVQAVYTEALLRMLVVVTAVACLVTYSGYVQQKESLTAAGVDVLWLTMLPATYGLLRCIVLLEGGRYDDPTELAAGDRPFQAAAGLFALLSAVALLGYRSDHAPAGERRVGGAAAEATIDRGGMGWHGGCETVAASGTWMAEAAQVPAGAFLVNSKETV